MDVLKRKRGSVKAKFTRLQSFLDGAGKPNLQALSARVEGLEQAWNEYNSIHAQILELSDKEEDIAAHELDYAESETQYYNLKEALGSRLAKEEKEMEKKTEGSGATAASVDIRLPRIELPKFSGNFLEWSTFFDLFSSIIHSNEKLSSAQKLHYLKSSVVGEAAALLQAIEVTDANYAEAWKLLTDRYQNKRQLVQCHLTAMFRQSNLTSESAPGMRQLLDTTVKHVRSLHALGLETDQWDPLLVFMVTDRLDNESRKQWELSTATKEYPTFEELKQFIEQRCRAFQSNQGQRINQRGNAMGKTRTLPQNSYYTSQEETSACPVCGDEHSVYRCTKFQNLNYQDKTDLVRKNKLCFNCLRTGHISKMCKSTRGCRSCGMRHHTLLHVQTPTIPKVTIDKGHSTTVSAHCAAPLKISQVLLSTALVNVRDSVGELKTCRALLDSGSQATFISEACVQRLGLKRHASTVSVSGIGMNWSNRARGEVEVSLTSRTTNFSTNVNALVLQRLTNVIPNTRVDISRWDGIANLTLADPCFNEPGDVDLLLGADVYSETLLDGKLDLGNDLPTAFNTKFGWIITGKIKKGNVKSISVNLSTVDLQPMLKRFWELEEVKPKHILSKDEVDCENHFTDTIQRDETGRYCVSLPRKSDLQLGASRDIATKRFLSMENKLQRNECHREQYQSFLTEYENLGHMVPIPEAERREVVNQTNYLPHHFVENKTSKTTSFRVVFDASAKTTNGVSLNDTLMVGPVLQENIWSNLVNFRCFKYAFTADIEKMYRQISVTDSDADFQRIIWRATPTDNLTEYRLKTVTYGTASAPYLATRVLQQLALDEGENFPLAKEVITRDFYMDDLLSGSDNLRSSLQLQRELIQLTEKGGFRLRKWSANTEEILEAVKEEDRESNITPLMEQTDCTKTLGLHWNASKDHFFFKITLSPNNDNVTKRKVISEVAKLFDPLGLVSPIILVAKMIIQKLWILGISWDEPLPESLREEWIRFRIQLPHLEKLYIPRFVSYESGGENQLHGFCDASQAAYGAAVYLRSKTNQGQISVHLICSKTKVAPLKPVTLPRLELCGAVLLARLLTIVQSSLHCEVNKSFAWTDSTVTLSWIKGHPRRWQTFVANRVAEIQELVSPEHWSYVQSSENPADVASRGLLPNLLSSHQPWWKGPNWLEMEETYWPKLNKQTDDDKYLPEQKQVKSFLQQRNASWDLVERFSTLNRLKRVTAYCLRFCNNVRTSSSNERITGPLTTQELQKALHLCVKNAQADEFVDSISKLQNGKPTSSTIQSLQPFLDIERVLRVGGRLRNSNISTDQRCPILLPKNHKLTELIIKDVHERNLHVGPQTTLAILHQTFWIVNGRSVVRKLLHKCLTCVRERAVTSQQMMGDLPRHRVEPNRAFLKTGVDYAGPLLIKSAKGRGSKTTKAYIALFVCFSTKAIHLELVSDLSTDAFLASLRRFIARRGHCSDIYSDNASNFVGANAQLKVLLRQFRSQEHNQTVADNLSTKGINWHFIPPFSPHFGGLWEAGVKSTKTHLQKIIGQTPLTFEELYTVLTQIEACLNSRPLTALSSDPSDLNVLTPGHFLIGESLSSIPEPDITHLKLNTLSRWQLTQRITQQFWKRWTQEYLHRLQQRPKWTEKRNNLEVNDLVLIKEQNLPPLKWPIGRVMETHPGKDKCVRVVTVKTSTGSYKRPITKLCALPS